MKTYSVKQADVKKNWVVVDAAGQTLGRLASQIALVLRGKHKPTYTPNMDTGDFVVVVNADKVNLTGTKSTSKFYFAHTAYIGGIKAIRADDLQRTKPERLVSLAVRGMLPKTKLGRKVFKNLKVYAGNEHPHKAQNPAAMATRLAGEAVKGGN